MELPLILCMRKRKSPFEPRPIQEPLPHRGGLILLFGFLGFITAGILGAVAWIWANRDLALMNMGIMDERGIDKTVYGRILGIVSSLGWLLAILIYIAVKALSMDYTQ